MIKLDRERRLVLSLVDAQTGATEKSCELRTCFSSSAIGSLTDAGLAQEKDIYDFDYHYAH